MEILSKLQVNPDTQYFQTGPESFPSRAYLGGLVSKDRPDSLAEGEIAYWNTVRKALRLRSPDPVKPWRTIAQGFANDVPCAVVSGRLAAHYDPRTVLIVREESGSDSRIFINLQGADGAMLWHRLHLRPDNLTDATWDPQSYVRAETYTQTTEAERTNETMSEQKNPKFEALKQMVAEETQQALWLSAATQATRTARDLLIASAKKAMPKQRLVINQIAKVLQTPVGEAAFGYALGLALEIKAGPADAKRRRLARELRIVGEAGAMNVVLNPIREFLTSGIDTILNGIDGLALPDVAPAALPEASPSRMAPAARSAEPVYAEHTPVAESRGFRDE